MSNEITIKFGTFNLDSTNNISVSKIEPEEKKDVNLSKIPVSDFSIAEEARRESISINMEGSIVGDDYDDLRTKIDAFKAALQGIQKLYFDDDRYIMAQVQDFSCPFSNMRRIARWKILFIAHDPIWLSDTLNSDERTPTSGSGYTITNSGNAKTRVKIEITAPAGGITDNCKIENQTTGQSFQYRGTVAAGDKLEVDNRVDTDDFEVLNDGADDQANFEGDFIELAAGNNTIIFTGPADSVVKISHRNAWY